MSMKCPAVKIFTDLWFLMFSFTSRTSVFESMKLQMLDLGAAPVVHIGEPYKKVQATGALEH